MPWAAERTVRVMRSRTVRYCITNLPVDTGTGAARVADLVRGHTGVENSLHWVLDDTPGKTRCRLRTGHAARNMAALRRSALNFFTLFQAVFLAKVINSPTARMVACNPARLEPIMAL